MYERGIERVKCECGSEEVGGGVGVSREPENKNETSLTMCEGESERLRQRDKTGELMSDSGSQCVKGRNRGRERWGGRKRSAWIVSSEEFMIGFKTHL